MNAVPLALKRSIGVGIGLFILFIGFANGGLIVSNCAPDSATLGFCDGTLVTLSFPTQPAQFVFILGLAITFVLYALRIRAALIVSILVTTVIAILVGVQKVDTNLVTTPSFGTLGLGVQDPFQVFAKLGVITAILTIFAIMLSDFFDTMGTVTGIAAEAGLAREDGSVPGIGRVLIVDSLAAVAGGLGGVSSNTTYIESAAGVAEGGKTGFASVVTGVLFLLAIFLSPIAGLIPSQATAPALVLVGYLMFTLVKDIPVGELEDGLPALLTMILMPLTYDITVGIGAGFISWVLLKVVRGKLSEIHPLMWVVSIAFVVYFANVWVQTLIK
jgi:AGZA family xanthine/uracil permease-like MFS transporter